MSKIDEKEYLTMVQEAYNQAYGAEENVFSERIVFSESELSLAAKERLLNSARRNIIDMTKMKRKEMAEKLSSARWITINNFVVQIYKVENGLFTLAVSEEKNKIHRKLDSKRDNQFDQALEWREFFQSKVAVRIPLERVVEMIRWIQGISKITPFC
jgi:hypothetical protein